MQHKELENLKKLRPEKRKNSDIRLQENSSNRKNREWRRGNIKAGNG